MAWLALEHWTRSAVAGSEIGSAMSIRGVSFEDSISSLWPGSSSRPLAFDLILAWGADLRLGMTDKIARNHSSYTPQALSPQRKPVNEIVDFVAEFWSNFEPAGDPFHSLDRHLFRLMVEKQYEVFTGANPVDVNARREDLTNRYGNLDPAVQAVITLEFLTRQSEPDDAMIIQSARQNSATPTAFEMVSRAGLLLRSATAMVSRALFDAGIQPHRDLAFWFTEHGESRGFWAPGAALADMQELWDDIAQAISDVKGLRDADRTAFSHYTWSEGPVNGIPRLGEAERIALWGICA
ncbi:hypothetical protein [Lysobacter sp. GCM10012299]|uniref:hypothetical protein n=1 Tax=Lysobacter sp. GCM10012299 TaxID=3317333 RepID=UPI00361DFF80